MSAATLALDFGGEETASPLDAPRLLLEQLRRRGVIVAVSGAKLKLDAPRGALEDLLPELQKFKPSLLELLQLERAGEAKGEPLEAARREQERAQSLELEEARERLTRLEVAKGTAGALRSIWRVSRRLERERPEGNPFGGFWRRLDAIDRHALTVCVALLEASLAIEGEAP